jgi:dienelactone hydrolase
MTLILRRLICSIWILLWVASSMSMAADAASGVVLLHGKDGTPRNVLGLADAMKKNGFAVTTPEMPYSRNRNFDKAYQDMVPEINNAVAELMKQGVKRIFIAGHSLGANVALYYATRVSVDGVLAIAPGHTPELKGFASSVRDSVQLARKMVSEGKGDKIGVFDDYNQGRRETRKTTATIYLSYVDPDGLAVMPRNAAALKPGTAFLWVVGTQDLMYERGPSYAFDKAPPNPNNKDVVVDGNHMNTPAIAAQEIVTWLKTFKPTNE